jgi:hypothetical protein
VRPRLAAVLLAVLAAGMPVLAARAQTAPPFEVIPRPAETHQSHRLFWFTAIVGVGLVASSFPLSHEADRRYAAYLGETDVSQIDARYDATTRMDYLASGALLVGEGLMVTAVWLRFLHAPPEGNRLAVEVEPTRCAVSLHF